DLRIDLRTLLLRGTMTGNSSNLVPWSRLAGTPLGGRLLVKAGLDTRAGQSLDLTLDGEKLSSGSAKSRITIAQLGVTARLSDLLGTPFGTGRATLTGAGFPSGELASAMLTVESPRPGRFTFGGETKGKLVEPLTLALGGTAEIASNGIELRVSRLGGAVGAARNLSIGSVGRLAGYGDAAGTLTLDASIGGTVTAPQGRFSLSGRELRFAPSKRQRMPISGLDLAGTWNGRELALTGKANGHQGDRLEPNGSAPLVLTSGMNVAVPPQGRLALRL